MYIVLKNNERTESIIESLNTFGEKVEVRKYIVNTYVEVDTSFSSTIQAYVSVGAKKLFVESRQDLNNWIEISLDDLVKIYNL